MRASSSGRHTWDRVDALRAKYSSVSAVNAMPLPALHDLLLAHGACMLSVLVDLPEDRRMAYQHANPNGFITATGIDKLSGARKTAARWISTALGARERGGGSKSHVYL